MKQLTLNDLTKAELITLINRYHIIAQREINKVRYDSLCAKSESMRQEALAEMKAIKIETPVDLDKYLEASRKFNRGIELHDEAGALLSYREEA